MLSREEIFSQAAKKLLAEFNELSIVPHNQLKGQEAEDIVKKFLDSHLPKRFAAGAGFILDPTGNISRQTDVIIYDAFNCPVYRASDDASIFPSNNVAAVVEVKCSLDKKQIEDAWEKIAAVKSLLKTKSNGGPQVSQTGGFVFAYSSKLTLTKLSEHYSNLFQKTGIGHHVDVICVLDKGIITLAAKPRGFDKWATMFMEGFGGVHGEGTHIAVSAMQFGEYTLDAFFRLLLPRLILFRHIVHHPGFVFQDMPVKQKNQLLSYLTSITTEKNPALREAKLKEYAKQVQDEFSQMPVPEDWEE